MNDISCLVKFDATEVNVRPSLNKIRVEVSLTRTMAEKMLDTLCDAFGEAWVVDFATGGTGTPRTGTFMTSPPAPKSLETPSKPSWEQEDKAGCHKCGSKTPYKWCCSTALGGS